MVVWHDIVEEDFYQLVEPYVFTLLSRFVWGCLLRYQHVSEGENITITLAITAVTVFEDIPSPSAASSTVRSSSYPKTMSWDGPWKLVCLFGFKILISAASIKTYELLPGFFWKRYVDGHLVRVKSALAGFWTKWVQAKRLTINAGTGSKSLDTQTVKGSVRGSSTGCSFDHYSRIYEYAHARVPPAFAADVFTRYHRQRFHASRMVSRVQNAYISHCFPLWASWSWTITWQIHRHLRENITLILDWEISFHRHVPILIFNQTLIYESENTVKHYR